MKNRFLDILLVICISLLILSCRKEQKVVIHENSSPVTVRGGYVKNIRAASDYYSLFIESEGEGWTCENSSDWLTLAQSEGHGNRFIDFSVTTNRNRFPRVTFIHIFDKNNPKEYHATVRVVQDAMSNEVQGTLTNTMEQQHRMGYGYNITMEYMNDSSFSKEPILNYSRITEMEKVVGNIITEDYRNTQEVELFSGVTLTEITVKMTEKKTEYSSFAGFGKSTQSATELFSQKSNTQECGIVRLKRIVTSRTVDMGMLRSQNLSVAEKDSSLTMFDKRFCDKLREMLDNPQEKMRSFFNEYGTHLVVSADLGGVQELYMVIDRSTSSETEHSVQSVGKLLFGMVVQQEISKNPTLSTSDGDIKYQAELKVHGGSNASRQALEEKINSAGQITDVISSQEMNDWQNSLVLKSSTTSYGPKYNAALVDCQVIPLYELIPDPVIRDNLESLTFEYLGTRKPNDRDEQTHGKYEVSQALKAFSTGSHSVQLVYNPNKTSESVGVVCKEYVSAIRSDRNSLVVYPMVNGFPYLYCGLFLGDESHSPGRVRWVGNQCLYEPNDSISRDNPKFQDWFDSEGQLKSVYFYWSSVHPAPEKLDAPQVEFVSRNGVADVSDINWDSPLNAGFNEAASTTDLVKVGPLFWSETSKPLRQTMAEWRYMNVVKHYGFDPGSGTKGYYSAISDVVTDDYISNRHSSIVLNRLPTEAQARSLMYVLNGRTELLDYGSDGRNRLGLIWPKGFYSVPYQYEVGEDKYVDTDALLILIQEPSPQGEYYTKMRLVRLGQSGRAARYTLEQYCKTVPDAGYSKFKYFPIFTATNYVK